MKRLDLKRVLSIVAFLALAAFSCYWTAESLYIWQPSITIIGAWLIAVVFYVVASLCFSLFLNSLDKNAYFPSNQGVFKSRGGKFALGIVGLIAFWFVFSMPTNTHTLLYRSSIKNVITTDLTRTQGYLQGLKDNNVKIKEIEARYNTKKNNVDALILRMIAEIDNPSAIGIGERFNTILAELEQELGTTIQRNKNIGTTRTQWLTTINYYQSQAYEQLTNYKAKCDNEIEEIRRMMGSKELEQLIANCRIALSDINNMDGVNNKVIKAATNDLTNAYSFIKTNSQYIEFKDNDKDIYTRDGAMPEAKAMLSVPDVWKDFLTTDKYKGHGFIWWVFIAILVDLAAFIFFNMAFGKKQNNTI